MKESTLATKVMIGILCVGVLIYLALYLLAGFQDNLVTAVAYQYQVNLGQEASGILIRQEQVLPSSGTYVDFVLSEGERAAAGDPVALIYSDSSALSTQQTIRTLSAEIDQLEYALSTGTQSVDITRLDQQVISSIVSLRALSAGARPIPLGQWPFRFREPPVLIAAVREFPAVRVLPGQIGTDNGGNSLRAYQLPQYRFLPLGPGIVKIISVILKRVLPVLLTDILKQIRKLSHKCIPGHSLASLNMRLIFCEYAAHSPR